MVNINSMIPVVMRVVRFHGRISLSGIRYHTGFGSASLRVVVNNLINNGLLKRDGDYFELTPESEHWLGWKSF